MLATLVTQIVRNVQPPDSIVVSNVPLPPLFFHLLIRMALSHVTLPVPSVTPKLPAPNNAHLVQILIALNVWIFRLKLAPNVKTLHIMLKTVYVLK